MSRWLLKFGIFLLFWSPEFAGLWIVEVLVHEIGHALMAVCYGWKITNFSIRANPFTLSGRVNYKQSPEDRPDVATNFAVTFLGPFTALVYSLWLLSGFGSDNTVRMAVPFFCFWELAMNVIPWQANDGSKMVRDFFCVRAITLAGGKKEWHWMVREGSKVYRTAYILLCAAFVIATLCSFDAKVYIAHYKELFGFWIRFSGIIFLLFSHLS